MRKRKFLPIDCIQSDHFPVRTGLASVRSEIGPKTSCLFTICVIKRRGQEGSCNFEFAAEFTDNVLSVTGSLHPCVPSTQWATANDSWAGRSLPSIFDSIPNPLLLLIVGEVFRLSRRKFETNIQFFFFVLYPDGASKVAPYRLDNMPLFA